MCTMYFILETTQAKFEVVFLFRINFESIAYFSTSFKIR